MNPQLWSWLLAAVGIAGIALAGKPHLAWLGWTVGFTAQALWIAYASVTGQWGFIVSALGYATVYGLNLMRTLNAQVDADRAAAVAVQARADAARAARAEERAAADARHGRLRARTGSLLEAVHERLAAEARAEAARLAAAGAHVVADCCQLRIPPEPRP